MAERTSFQTNDEYVAASTLEDMYKVRLTAGDGPAAAHWRLAVTQVKAPQLTVSDLQVPAEMHYEIVGREELVLATVRAGRSEVGRDGVVTRYEAGDTYVGMAPEAKWFGRTHEAHLLSAQMPMSLVQDMIESDPERSDRPLSFLDQRPSAAGAGRWRATTRFVTDLLTRDDTADAPLITGQATRLMAATALHVFPNTAVARDNRSNDRDAHPDALRRATAFIEANPDLDITLRDIAQAAYVTPRAVQLAFRRHLDTTPTAYLRRVRLHQARQQLEDAGPEDGLTVTRVAIDWGFASPSRFAAHYRAAFGEAPHDTLTR